MIWNGLDSISMQENNFNLVEFKIIFDWIWFVCKNLVRFHFNIVYLCRTINWNDTYIYSTLNQQIANLITAKFSSRNLSFPFIILSDYLAHPLTIWSGLGRWLGWLGLLGLLGWLRWFELLGLLGSLEWLRWLGLLCWWLLFCMSF